MPYYKEQVFLLSKTDYRDSDIIVNLLSSTQGLLSTVIYRGKNMGGKSSFTYSPGDLLELEYQTAENREFIKVINLRGIDMLPTDRFSYDRFVFHCYLLELITKIVKPGEPSGDLVDLLKANQKLDWSENSHNFISRSLWQIIHHGGFDIDIHHCTQCGRESFRDSEDNQATFRKGNYRLGKSGGGLLCEQCLGPVKGAFAITPAMIKILYIYQYNSNNIHYDIAAPAEIVNSLILILNPYLLNHFEIRPKSLDMFLSLID